jgi:methylamine---glutamate N-methyltransferase subunit A
MCGIVGLFAKSPEIEAQLGRHLAAMLVQLGDRGPDSSGVAVYREPVASGSCKLTLFSADPEEDWAGLGADLGAVFGGLPAPAARGSHAVVVVEADASDVEPWLKGAAPHVRVMSAGEVIELFKETGRPEEFVARFGLTGMEGTHGLGHTRMATESLVTTEGSHPFSTGLDLCLVHNGSLSNHNRLREVLRREGIEFKTDNDTEVAAGYLTWRLREGAPLEQALEDCLEALDGFYTFLVGTRDGFAVLRDPIACKPAVIAESEEWVAMASEWRAIAVLPGAAQARMWEPEPAVVYAWERVLA